MYTIYMHIYIYLYIYMYTSYNIYTCIPILEPPRVVYLRSIAVSARFRQMQLSRMQGSDLEVPSPGSLECRATGSMK